MKILAICHLKIFCKNRGNFSLLTEEMTMHPQPRYHFSVVQYVGKMIQTGATEMQFWLIGS